MILFDILVYLYDNNYYRIKNIKETIQTNDKTMGLIFYILKGS
jgi:hypothetical protein